MNMDVYDYARQYAKLDTEMDRHDKHRRFLESRKSSRKQGMRQKKKGGKRK
jgi:hypothetical protein